MKPLSELKHLVSGPGHAVLMNPQGNLYSDEAWYLLPYQKGEPPFYIEHIREAVQITHEDAEALYVPGGGKTRPWPKSEGLSYWEVAHAHRWWAHEDVSLRTYPCEFATNSIKNLTFAICRFREVTGHYPERITVVNWPFKEERFVDYHRAAIRFPKDRFTYKCAGDNPKDLGAAMKGEQEAIELYKQDPFGVRGKLAEQERARNRFFWNPPFEITCPELRDLLAYRGDTTYPGPLPWSN